MLAGLGRQLENSSGDQGRDALTIKQALMHSGCASDVRIPLTRRMASGVQLHRLMLIAALMSVSPVGQGLANEIAGSGYTVGLWKGAAYTDDATGSFGNCEASVGYRNGDVIYYTIDADGLQHIGIRSSDLNDGRTSQMSVSTVTIDGRQPRQIVTLRARPGFYFLDINDDLTLLNQFKAGRNFRIEINGKVLNYNLRDSSRAVDLTRECAEAQRRSMRANVAGPPLDPRPAPAQPPASSVTAPAANAPAATDEQPIRVETALASGRGNLVSGEIVEVTRDGTTWVRATVSALTRKGTEVEIDAVSNNGAARKFVVSAGNIRKLAAAAPPPASDPFNAIISGSSEETALREATFKKQQREIQDELEGLERKRQEAEAFRESLRDMFQGAWKGTYNCSQGPTGLTVTIEDVLADNTMIGKFEFYLGTSSASAVVSGKYELFLNFNEQTRMVTASPGPWIEQPSGYGTVGFSAELRENELIGKISDMNCGALKVVKIPAAAPPPAAATVAVPQTVTATGFAVDDQVEILYGGTWYPGAIKEVRADGTWRISYDGFGSNWDENVTANRLRARGSAGERAAPSSNSASALTEKPTSFPWPAHPRGFKADLGGAYYSHTTSMFNNIIQIHSSVYFLSGNGRFARSPSSGFSMADLETRSFALEGEGIYWIEGNDVIFRYADESYNRDGRSFTGSHDSGRLTFVLYNSATLLREFERDFRIDGTCGGGASIGGGTSSASTLTFSRDGTYRWSSTVNIAVSGSTNVERADGSIVRYDTSGGSSGANTGKYEFNGYSLKFVSDRGQTSVSTVAGWGDDLINGLSQYLYIDGTMMSCG